VLVMVVARG